MRLFLGLWKETSESYPFNWGGAELAWELKACTSILLGKNGFGRQDQIQLEMRADRASYAAQGKQ